MERGGPARPVAHGDQVGAVSLGDGQQRIALQDPDPRRLVGEMVDVEINQTTGYSLYGDVVPSGPWRLSSEVPARLPSFS